MSWSMTAREELDPRLSSRRCRSQLNFILVYEQDDQCQAGL